VETLDLPRADRGAAGLPDSTAEIAVLGGAARLAPLFRTDHVEAAAWRCLVDGPEMGRDRAHARPTISFNFAGRSMVHADGRERVLDATRAIVHSAGAAYNARHPWGCRCRGALLYFEPELFAELAPRWATIARSATVVAPPRLLARGRLLFARLAERAEIDPLEVEEEAVAVARALLGGGEETGPTPGRREETRRLHHLQIERACGYLGEALAERRTLGEVARAAHASPAHLGRIFRAETGVPLHLYRLRLRLLAAFDALCDGGGDLSTLAHELGFSSHSHLTASFRRVSGCPPRELRRRLGGGAARAAA